MSQMDEVDQRQQDEIINLQKKDIQHDEQLSLWTKLSMIAFAIVLALFVGGMIMSPILLSQKTDPIREDLMAGYRCPHADCPHHMPEGHAPK